MVYEFGARLLQLRKAKNLLSRHWLIALRHLTPTCDYLIQSLVNMKVTARCHG